MQDPAHDARSPKRIATRTARTTKAEAPAVPDVLCVDLVLIDGSSYLYRAYPRSTQPDQLRGRTDRGAARCPDDDQQARPRATRSARVAVVFDAPGKTFRDELVRRLQGEPPADARRPAQPGRTDTRRPCRFDGPAAVAGSEGVEADDVIGTLCTRSHGKKGRWPSWCRPETRTSHNSSATRSRSSTR